MTSDEYADCFEEIMRSARAEWESEKLQLAKAICALVDAYDDDKERDLVLCTLPLDVHVTVMRSRFIAGQGGE